MATSTAQRIREAAQAGEPRLLSLDERVLKDAVARLSAGARLRLAERDRLLQQLILAYRRGPREVWSPLLLEALAPSVIKRLERFSHVRPVVSQEDIAQQLMVELLETALTMPLRPEAGYLERRLMLWAAKKVSRRLRREVRIQERLEPLPEPNDDGDEADGQ